MPCIKMGTKKLFLMSRIEAAIKNESFWFFYQDL